MGEVLLKIKNLYFRHSVNEPWILRDLSLQIQRGECVVVMGSSGCGKSTLLRLVAGILVPQQGNIWHEQRSIQAMVFQDQRLLPWKTAEQNVIFGLTRHIPSRKEKQEHAQAALAHVQGAHLAKKYPHQLSGGERQRVGLARALAASADLLLLDEPLSALDERSQDELLSIIHTIKQKQLLSMLYVTHSQREAYALGSRSLQLSDGRMLEDHEKQLSRRVPLKQST